MSHRRHPYQRAKRPGTLRLTDRDIRILECIHAFDGMMSLEQIDKLFFSGQGRTQPRHRMRRLYDHNFVNKPTSQSIHQVPLGASIFWLGRKGAEMVASLQGRDFKDLQWRKKPRYSQVAHDLAVNDFRIIVNSASENNSQLKLLEWQAEGEFLAHPDTIWYEQSNGKRRKRQIRPDGFFILEQQPNNSPLAFLLEIDMSTEDNPRFGREKVRPGVAYLKSKEYKQRFGLHYGRYLVVTTGERRLQNLKVQTERVGGNGLFYFTTFKQVTSQSVLSQPIWYLAGEQQTQSIIPST